MKKYFLLLCWWFFSAAQNFAQSKSEFLTIDQGLSQNYVFDVFQDSKGFIWFGTKEGLNRYDGYSVIVYRNDPFDSTTLSSNTVTTIFEDNDKSLWIGTNGGGLNKFDRASEKFIHFTSAVNKKKSLSHNHILNISQGMGNTLWIGTMDGANLFDVHSGTFTQFRYDSTNRNTIAGAQVSEIRDERDTVWFATNGGLCFLVRATGKIIRWVEDQVTEKKNRGITLVFRDSKKRLFIGRRSGLYSVTPNGFIPVFTANDENKLYWVTKIREDQTGTFWITTGSTLLTLSSDLQRMDYKERLAKERFSPGLWIDYSGVVWAGTSGLGVLTKKIRQELFGKHEGNFLSEIFEKEIDAVNQYCKKKNIPYFVDLSFRGMNFSSIVEGNNNDAWILTPNKLFNVERGGKIRNVYSTNPTIAKKNEQWSVNKVAISPVGEIYVATVGGINKLDKQTGTFSHIRLYPDSTLQPDMLNKASYYDITEMFWDTKNILWCGTPDRGIIRYDESKNDIQYFSHNSKMRGSLSNNHVLVIYNDPMEFDSILWIGTDGGGLNRFNTKSGNFSYITKKEGMPNDVVYGILEDGQKNLWMSTNFGIVKLNAITKEIRAYDVQDGLQSNEFNRNEYYKSNAGKMYFGGIYGYNAFLPSSIQDNLVKPSVVITDFRLFNKSISHSDSTLPLKKSITETDSITVEYSQNMFTFQFAALDFNVPRKNRYRYMLQGFDDKWITAGPSRTATYTNINPGVYIFRVIASNSDGVWNEQGTSLVLEILPPFWMTWWFRGMLIVFFLSFGPIIYFVRVNQLKREKQRQQEVSQLLIQSQEQERKRIAQEMHDSLGQELLVIKNRAMIGLKTANEGTKEKEQLEKISDNVSSILKLVRSISHSLRPPELDRLGITETIRAMLYNVQDTASYKVLAEIDEIDGVLPKEQEINFIRIIQESLNNIEKHSRAKHMRLTIVRSEKQLILSIQDDGVGFLPEQIHQGIGLAGMSERVRILNGDFSIHSLPGLGTTITIQIPIV